MSLLSVKGEEQPGLAERTTKHQNVFEIFPHSPDSPIIIVVALANEARRRPGRGITGAHKRERLTTSSMLIMAGN